MCLNIFARSGMWLLLKLCFTSGGALEVFLVTLAARLASACQISSSVHIKSSVKLPPFKFNSGKKINKSVFFSGGSLQLLKGFDTFNTEGLTSSEQSQDSQANIFPIGLCSGFVFSASLLLPGRKRCSITAKRNHYYYNQYWDFVYGFHIIYQSL